MDVDRKTVGILGGMGPLATSAFYQRLIEATGAQSDQEHLHVIIESFPSIPDRTAFLEGSGADPRPFLLEVATRLVAAGCQLLVMPCNTAHAFFDYLAPRVAVPIAHWIETAVASCSSAPGDRVGVLATRGTIVAGLYDGALRARGLIPLVPDTGGMAALTDAIYRLKAGDESVDSQESVLEVGDALVTQGAKELILGCTELPLIVPADDRRWRVPVVDPSIVMAREIVRLAGGQMPGARLRGTG